ncbi:MAG TPA: class I SAM-dependent methyltransferase [Alphaproteobacteria bacterium]|nr:class I SAM-dependent methyltransferase [Alphaproteobacteria bacterium]
MSDPVRAQYEEFPYPPRDPRHEAKRLIVGSPSHLVEVNHFVFGGRLDLARPFRALVAGGGTGDAAIMIAQQLVDRGARASEVVYIDLSTASRAVAEARAAARRLDNIRFISASLLDLPRLDLGRFDYVDCCGVLHHLDDPLAGLMTLVQALRPGGGMGLMLYGTLGRAGVYPAQDALRRLVHADETPTERVALARRFLAQLPATNWIKRNPFIADHITEGDAGVHDLLLHARDRAYRVEEVAALVDGAGLRWVSFVPPARYDPFTYTSDATLRRRIEALAPIARAALAEEIVGNMKTHAFYVVAADNAVTPPSPDDPAAVPVLHEATPEALARGLRPGGVLKVSAEGFEMRFALPPLAPAIGGMIDGERSLAEIHRALASRDATLDWRRFCEQFGLLYRGLHGVGKLFLAYRA